MKFFIGLILVLALTVSPISAQTATEPIGFKHSLWLSFWSASLTTFLAIVFGLPVEWKTCEDEACNAFKATIQAKNEGFTGLCFDVHAEGLDQPVEIEMLKNLTCQDRFAIGTDVKICLNRRALWVLPV